MKLPTRTPEVKAITFRAEDGIIDPLTGKILKGAISSLNSARRHADVLSVISPNPAFPESEAGQLLSRAEQGITIFAPQWGETLRELYKLTIEESTYPRGENMVVETSEAGVAIAKELGCFTVALVTEQKASEHPDKWGAEWLFTERINLNHFIMDSFPRNEWGYTR